MKRKKQTKPRRPSLPRMPRLLVYGGAKPLAQLMQSPWFRRNFFGMPTAAISIDGVLHPMPPLGEEEEPWSSLVDLVFVGRATAGRSDGFIVSMKKGGAVPRRPPHGALGLSATLLTAAGVGLKECDYAFIAGLGALDAPLGDRELDALRGFALDRNGWVFVSVMPRCAVNRKLIADLFHHGSWVEKFGAFGMEPIDDPDSPEAIIRTVPAAGSRVPRALPPELGLELPAFPLLSDQVVLPVEEAGLPPEVNETRGLQRELLVTMVEGDAPGTAAVVAFNRNRVGTPKKMLVGDMKLLVKKLTPMSLTTADLWIPRFEGDDGSVEGQSGFQTAGQVPYLALGHEIFSIEGGTFAESESGRLVRVSPSGSPPNLDKTKDHVLAIYVSNRGLPVGMSDVVHVMGYLGCAVAGGSNSLVPLDPIRLGNAAYDDVTKEHQVVQGTPGIPLATAQLLAARPKALVLHQGLLQTNRDEAVVDPVESGVITADGFDPDAIWGSIDGNTYNALKPVWTGSGYERSVVSEHVAFFKILAGDIEDGTTAGHFCSFAFVSTRQGATNADFVQTKTEDGGEVVWDDVQGIYRNNITQRNLGGVV